MKRNLIINLLFLFGFILLPIKYVNSADYTTTGSIDFGVIMQNAIPSIIPVTSDGLRDESGTYGVYRAQNPSVSNTITFTTTGNIIVGERIIITNNMNTEEFNIDGCSHSFSNVSTQNNNFFMSSSSYSLPFSLTLTISNFCTPDKNYTGQFYIQYRTQTCILGGLLGCYDNEGINEVPFQYSFRIEEPLGADEIEALNFGAIMPIFDGAGTVTIAPEDESVTVTGDIKYLYSGYSRGIYQIYGIGNRMVNITMPDSVIITNVSNDSGDTMVVNNFRVSSTYNYTQTNDGAKVEIPLNDLSFDNYSNFFVGATLNVGAGVSEGQYRGEYTIYLSY